MKIIHISEIPETGVSHNEEIKKKVFLEKGLVPHVMTFASATFKPGQSVETHKHDTMYEVFYILNGRAKFVVNGADLLLEAGNCVVIEPGELHSQTNPYDDNVTWLYFGVATDQAE
jgi:quercetin dioxygenase-like cupin family protein